MNFYWRFALQPNLGLVLTGSIVCRLNLQHYLWKDQAGYLVHPSIPLTSPNLKIADVGTGTGYVLTFSFR